MYGVDCLQVLITLEIKFPSYMVSTRNEKKRTFKFQIFVKNVETCKNIFC